MESQIESPLALSLWESHHAANEEEDDKDDQPESPFIDESNAGSDEVRELTKEKSNESGKNSSSDFTRPKTLESAACSVRVDERRHKQEIIEQSTAENDVASHIFKLNRSSLTNEDEVGRNDIAAHVQHSVVRIHKDCSSCALPPVKHILRFTCNMRTQQIQCNMGTPMLQSVCNIRAPVLHCKGDAHVQVY